MIKEMAESNVHVDMVNLMMSRMIQEKNVANRLESDLILVIQLIIQKIGQFNFENIMRFFEVCEHEMADRGATGLHIVAQFNRVVTLDV